MFVKNGEVFFFDAPLNAMLRAMPMILISSSIFDAINKHDSWIYPISLGTIEIANALLKKRVFKPLMGTHKWPIIGSGERPKNAINCGSFINPYNPFKPSSSYGMPSGHSQLAVAVATYQILKHNFKTESILFWGAIASTTSISRYTLGCHTPQQVIVGVLLGLSCGYSIFYLRNNFDGISIIQNLQELKFLRTLMPAKTLR